MKQFTYLHFSDLHMGNKVAKPFLSHIKSELLKDIKYISGELDHIDVIFMTGDLTQSGSETEYKEFEGFMNNILNVLKDNGSNPYLFFVPGNHDMERLSDTSDPTHQAIKMWNNNSDFRKNIFWTGDAYRNYCLERFKNYTNFIKHYSNIPSDNLKVGNLPGDFFSNVDVNGVKLGVLGLNSSFLQIEAGNYIGKLGIYMKQIESVFGSQYVETLSQNDVNILLTHHNIDWYESDSRSEYQGEIYLKDQILEHYCGHNHIPQTEYISHNYVIESRVNIGPSLCGLEFFGDNIERIHGYQAGRYSLNDDGSIVKQIYPRLAVQRNSMYYIDRDINYQCEKGKEFAEVILKAAQCESEERKYSASDITDILSDDKPKAGSIQLHPITIHGDQAYKKVRIQEQREAERTLSDARCLWISTSFGLGEEQFIACVLKTLQVDLKGVFQLNCEDVETYSGLDKLVREHFSVSLNNLVDELSLACDSPVLIFSNITKSLVEKELAALSTMASSMTKYNEQLRMIFISSEIPADGYFKSIQLQPLSKSDLKHFVDVTMPGKGFTSFEIDKILDITNGYPICLDIIVKQLEYADLDDLSEMDFSFSQDELKIPMAIREYIQSLKASSQSSERNCYSLLVLLSLLPKGDIYSSIKRYQSTSPYKPAEVDILKSRNLITVDHYYVIKNHSLISSIDVLRIPKIYRDFILSLESSESLREQCSTICEMYLGNDWIQGNLKIKKATGDIYYSFTYYNTEAAICYLLRHSIEENDSENFVRYLVVAGNYVYELEMQHFYYVALYVGDSFYQLVKDHILNGADRSFSFLKYELADMLRMNTYYDESEELFLSVLEESLLDKNKMQISRQCLGLLYTKRDDKDKAIYYADEMLKNEKDKLNSINALWAKYIKALNVDDIGVKIKEMKAVYRLASKNSDASLISANSARYIATLAPSEASLKMIDKELKKFKVSYTWMQLIQCKYNMYTDPSLQKTLTETDIEFVRKVYSYSFSQMMVSMLNDSHRILWDYYLQAKDYTFLANMLHHSLYVWELNNANDQIAHYTNEMKENADFLEWINANISYNEDALSLERNWDIH